MSQSTLSRTEAAKRTDLSNAWTESWRDATRATEAVLKTMKDAPFHVRLALRRLLGLQYGQLTIAFPSGRKLRFEGRRLGPEAFIEIHNFRFARRALARGDIGFAEGYMEGEWDTPDLADLLEVFALNLDGLVGVVAGGPFARFLLSLQHRLRANSKAGSKRNIAAHYDLGNDFYSLWLDESMTYSSGIFADDGTTLAQSQQAKYARLADAIGLEQGDSVLEIGCGWGGFAVYAAGERGADMHCLTLSKEQKAFAEGLIAERGLAERIDIRLQDYRDETGQYDRIASIEMIEAVGEEYWEAYFGKIAQSLKPGGKAGIQAITIRDDVFEDYRLRTDFIQKYIFPGGMLISKQRLREETEKAGMTLEAAECFGDGYARTLAEWDERFCQAWPKIEALGFDERFKRMWRFYLCYCQAGFRTGRIDVGQYVLAKPG